MRGKAIIYFILIPLLLGFSNLVAASEYDHETKAKDMSFAWKIVDDNLHVKISAKTTGWVGIGFNPEDQMKGADYVLGYVKNGKVSLRDDYGDSARNHKSDEKLGGQDNVTTIGGEEKGGTTTLEFSIPLNSGDKYDSVLEPDGDTVVLLAYGGKRDSFRSKHKYRGSFKINLRSGKVEEI